MQKALRLLFNLHCREERRVFLFSALGLVWGIGCYGTLALVEGLFIENLGASELPKIYLMSSLILCLLSSFILFNLFKKRVSPTTLFLVPVASTLGCNVYLLFYTLATPVLPKFPLFAYRVLIWGLTILSYTNFWGFVDQFFNLQDGKRHFCILNAAVFLGDAIGSGMVAFFIHKIGVQGILLLFNIALMLTFPIVSYISKTLKFLSDDYETFINAGHPLPAAQVFKLCFKDKYTISLLCFYFLMQLLAIATELNYLKILDIQFSGKKEFLLTSYIGTCALWISLGNMCFALFAYSRIIKTLGVNNIILLAPLCFFSLFLYWTFKSPLGLVTVAMVIREGVTYALDDNNLMLLIYGVPNKIRNQIRIIIESFIEPIGMLFWAITCFLTSNQQVLCLCISALTIVLVYLVRTYYAKGIFKNLSTQALRFDKSIEDWVQTWTTKQKRQVELFLLAHLKHPNEYHQTLAFQYLLYLGSRSVLPTLLAHMNKLSLPNKLKAINMLKESLWAKDFLTLELLKRWTRKIPHPLISAAIHLYFAEHDLFHITNIVEDLYDHSGDRLLAAILVVRRQKICGPYRDLANSRLKELLNSKNQQGLSQALTILTLEKNEENFLLLLDFLESSDSNILTQTCKALSVSVTPSHKPYCHKLISALKHVSYNNQACYYLLQTIIIALDPALIKDLLVTVSMLKSSSRKLAESIIKDLPKEFAPAFLQVLSDENLHNRTRILAAKILCKINSWLLKKHAYKIIKSKARKALFYAYHKQYIQQKNPEYNLGVLVDTLNSNYHAEVNFMLTILGMLGSVEYSDVLIRALIGKNQKVRAQALESLEKNCDSYLFSLCEPFINQPTLPHSEKYYFKCGIVPLSLKELLNMMENSPSYLSKLAARQLKQELIYCSSEFYSLGITGTLEEQEDRQIKDNADTLLPFF